MPIDLNILNNPINRCIFAKSEQLVSRAISELEFAHGESWWHLVVELGEGRFAATSFKNLSPLAQSEGYKFFNRPLSSLVGSQIPVVMVVEQSEIGTDVANDRAYVSPGRVLVVTQAGQFLGIIYQGEAGGDLEERPILSMYMEYKASMYTHAEPPEVRDTQPETQMRYIQAQVYEPIPGELQVNPDNPLQANRDYAVNVRIGPPDPKWLGPPSDAVFPDHELPKTESVHRLQVVFFEPFHAPQPKVQTIELPALGASSIASFNFRTLPDHADFEARIVMLYENRILQTALLRSRVLTPDRPMIEQGEAGLHMVIEAVIRNNLSELEKNQAFGAALVLNHNPAGESNMQAIAGEKALVISLGGVQPQVDSIKNELSKIYLSPERFEDGLWGDASQQLLFQLAVSGSKLYRKLLAFQGFADHPIFKQDRLQIVTTNIASFLPLEYIYDRQPPRLDPPARLCIKEKAEICLQGGTCQCDLPDEREAVCPLGFWGMRKVIERFAFKRPPDDQTLQGESFKVYAGINGDRAELRPFQRVIYAASDKVNEDQAHPNQIQTVLDALQQASGDHAQKVSNWVEWRLKVIQSQPSLLVLLPHHTIHPDYTDIHGLEIGANQRLWDTDMENQDVQAPGSGERPVVFLLGCETMSMETLDESFVATFLSLGAAIVLGTTTSVLGYHVAPVACKIAETMQAIIAEGAQSFADVMLRLRRQAMLEGYPMVLTLFAYGDAGWELTPAQN